MVIDIEENNNINTDEYIVAYIDILGTKEKVKNAKDFEYLKLIKSLYNITFSLCESMNDWNNSFLDKCSIRIFSDNILILYKCSNEHLKIPTMETLICFVSSFQALALYNNLFVRGAISYGTLYIDDIFIYGQVLVDVVEAEENIAKYPRVIFCKNIINDFYLNKDSSSIATDYDGNKYVNFYTSLTKTIGNRITNKEVLKIKNILTEERFKYHKDKKVKEKIDWMIQYHNSYVSKLIGTWGITEEHLITPLAQINSNIITRKNTEPQNAK